MTLLGSCTGEPAANGPLSPAETARLNLLGSRTTLPAGASNVWLFAHVHGDDLQLVRFDAPVADARAMARAALGRDPVRGEDPGIAYGGTRLHWWIHDFPPMAEGGSGIRTGVHVGLVMIPHGEAATVWVMSYTS